MNEFIRKMLLHGRASARGSNGEWIDVFDVYMLFRAGMDKEMADLVAYLKFNGCSSLYFCGWLGFYCNAPLCQLLGFGGRMWVADGDEIYELYGSKLDAIQRQLSHVDYRDDLERRSVCLVCIVPMEGAK